jgi:hypothetical protein
MLPNTTVKIVAPVAIMIEFINPLNTSYFCTISMKFCPVIREGNIIGGLE